MGRLLLTIEQAAVLADVERKEILRRYRAGEFPRWNLPGKRDCFFDARDIESAFGVSLNGQLAKR